jgi:hypothetical protein
MFLRWFVQERQRGGTVLDECKHWGELADPEDLVDVLVHLAEHEPSPLLAGQPVQGEEATQRRRASEDHAIEVDYEVGLAFRPDVSLVMLAKVADGVRVQSQAIPELGDEDSSLVPDLNHGLEHERPVR